VATIVTLGGHLSDLSLVIRARLARNARHRAWPSRRRRYRVREGDYGRIVCGDAQSAALLKVVAARTNFAARALPPDGPRRGEGLIHTALTEDRPARGLGAIGPRHWLGM